VSWGKLARSIAIAIALDRDETCNTLRLPDRLEEAISRYRPRFGALVAIDQSDHSTMALDSLTARSHLIHLETTTAR
jgi:hypothetical protein